MKNILDYFSKCYFTAAINILLALICLAFSFSKNTKNKKLLILRYFFYAYLLEQSIALWIEYYKPKYRPFVAYLFQYTDFLVTIFEFSLFVFFIRSIISQKSLKKLVSLLSITFYLFVLVLSVSHNLFQGGISQHFLQNIYIVESVFLILSCVIYYVDLFRITHAFNLVYESSFWVITGIALFSLGTLPFSIIGEYFITISFQLYAHLFAIFEIFYSVLFLMIIRAYLCMTVNK